MQPLRLSLTRNPPPLSGQAGGSSIQKLSPRAGKVAWRSHDERGITRSRSAARYSPSVSLRSTAPPQAVAPFCAPYKLTHKANGDGLPSPHLHNLLCSPAYSIPSSAVSITSSMFSSFAVSAVANCAFSGCKCPIPVCFDQKAAAVVCVRVRLPGKTQVFPVFSCLTAKHTEACSSLVLSPKLSRRR